LCFDIDIIVNIKLLHISDAFILHIAVCKKKMYKFNSEISRKYAFHLGYNNYPVETIMQIMMQRHRNEYRHYLQHLNRSNTQAEEADRRFAEIRAVEAS